MDKTSIRSDRKTQLKGHRQNACGDPANLCQVLLVAGLAAIEMHRSKLTRLVAQESHYSKSRKFKVEENSTRPERQEEKKMKRQIAKVLMMALTVVGLALASAAVANGQSGKQLTAQIPFDFIVAEKTLRSGQYEVRSASSAGEVLAIREANGKERVMRLTFESGSKPGRDMNAKLVFHRYGNTYFLSQVWMAGKSTGRELAKTRQERAIESELKAIAAYHGETKPVYEIVEVIVTAR
jgi:hypothetical protein